jgi:hypothetical protein
MLRPGDRPRKDVSGSCSSLTSSKKLANASWNLALIVFSSGVE